MHVCGSSNIDIEDTLLTKSILVPLLIIGIVTLLGMTYFNSAEAVLVDRYWSVLEPYDQSAPNTYAHGFIGVKFREDFQ
jgi:hypothetical protein